MAEVQEIGVGLIDRDETQPRQDFDEGGIAELARSIKANGLLQPVTVRRRNGRYQLVAGERRYRAVLQLGWETIPAIVQMMNDDSFRKFQMIENVVRRQLNSVELALGLKQMLDEGIDIKEAAEAIGRDVGYVRWVTSILNCGEPALHLVKLGQITVWVAWHLARLSDDGQRLALRIFQMRHYSAKEMVRQCERIYARENQLEMPVDVPEKTKKQAEKCPTCGQVIK